MKRPQVIGVLVKPSSVDAVQEGAALADWLAQRGLTVLLSDRVEADAVVLREGGRVRRAPEGVIGRESDVIVSLGGDGTLIRAVHAAAGREVPILGVNMGRLGFLTETHPRELERSLMRVLEGNYEVERRAVIEAVHESHGEAQAKLTALNEAAIAQRGAARLLTMRVEVNGKLLADYLANGLIFATPTGSTAYSLSAGGPLISPDVRAFSITPICPHTLSNRPIVIGDASEAVVTFPDAAATPVVTTDGHRSVDLAAHDRVVLRRAKHDVLLLHTRAHDHFAVLRTKLGWADKPRG